MRKYCPVCHEQLIIENEDGEGCGSDYLICPEDEEHFSEKIDNSSMMSDEEVRYWEENTGLDNLS